jgi:uncharacterized coiled-coil protein SlyX
MSDSQLSELEARYAWLERHVTEQDKVILALGEEVRRLRRELEKLRENLSNRPAASEPESPPPHY